MVTSSSGGMPHDNAPVVIDCDTHLYERRALWSDYADPGDRELALQIVDDDLGHAWLTHAGRRIHIAEVHHPRDVAAMGEYRSRVRRGEPPLVRYDDALPRDFWDPAARRDSLSERGVDEAVVFPNFGLLWERPLAADLPATLANMRAWNRWAADVYAEGQGRLHPVGHLSLRDLDWLETELRTLSSAGVHLAMVAPAVVAGRRLSHPELERAWATFEAHQVSPVFHVSAFPHPFHDAWYADDSDTVSPVLSSVFLPDAAAMSIADLTVHGVLERHPQLRIGVFELSAVWLPLFLLMLDGGFDFHARFNGEPLTRLPLRPSEYVRRQVRVAAFSYEGPLHLIEQAGDVFMACSDYPHAEGTPTPMPDYAQVGATPAGNPGLFGGNVSWLLHRG
jgi:hypothetical protein